MEWPTHAFNTAPTPTHTHQQHERRGRTVVGMRESGYGMRKKPFLVMPPHLHSAAARRKEKNIRASNVRTAIVFICAFFGHPPHLRQLFSLTLNISAVASCRYFLVHTHTRTHFPRGTDSIICVWFVFGELGCSFCRTLPRKERRSRVAARAALSIPARAPPLCGYALFILPFPVTTESTFALLFLLHPPPR